VKLNESLNNGMSNIQWREGENGGVAKINVSAYQLGKQRMAPAPASARKAALKTAWQLAA
jgi:hypothetical protein